MVCDSNNSYQVVHNNVNNRIRKMSENPDAITVNGSHGFASKTLCTGRVLLFVPKKSVCEVLLCTWSKRGLKLLHSARKRALTCCHATA